MSDRTLLYDASGSPVRRVLDGEDAMRALLVEVFGRLAGHQKAKLPSFLLAQIEQAVGVPAITKRFPDMEAHIGRSAMRHRTEELARAGLTPRGES